MIIPIFIPQLGCPGRCLYCSQEGLTGEAGLPGPERVDETVRLYLGSRMNAGPAAFAGAVVKGEVHEIAFFGGSFTLLPGDIQERLLAAAQRWLGREGIGGLRLSTRPDGIDRATVERLRHYGVTVVEVGAQSMHAPILERTGRGHGPADTVRAVDLLRRAGVQVGIHLMTGLPGDDEAGALSSLQECLWLKPDFLRIHPTLVLKESPLERLWRAGAYRPWGWGRMLRLLSRMAALCACHRVPVVRWGLMPGELCDRATLAGPASPSLGEWVRRYLAYRYTLANVAALLAGGGSGLRSGACCCHLIVPPQDLSLVTGHRQWLLRQVNAAVPLTISGVTPLDESGARVRSTGVMPFQGDWRLACEGRTLCHFDLEAFISALRDQT
ncbi:radical SAM protein [Heliobacterium undosum]|uniref:Radical SAM protein n=1 Tax=Heliomicrobium undosum TaxID=121734 RepID=A0A845L0I5_9FIRM|nr:radical SAM protein [Heliomicrobium undosum]MZP29086.1 radical SAM protein [Heliomicrobium undosum]